MSTLRIRYFTDEERNENDGEVIELLEKVISSFFSQYLARGIELQLEFPKHEGENVFPAGSLTLCFPEAGITEERLFFEETGAREVSAGSEMESDLRAVFQRFLLSVEASDASAGCRPEG
jgi:hypothetical protein